MTFAAADTTRSRKTSIGIHLLPFGRTEGTCKDGAAIVPYFDNIRKEAALCPLKS